MLWMAERNITVESWGKKTKETGLAYIWHNRHENINKINTFLKDGSNEIFTDLLKALLGNRSENTLEARNKK
jgi:hypothetical protein